MHNGGKCVDLAAGEVLGGREPSHLAGDTTAASCGVEQRERCDTGYASNDRSPELLRTDAAGGDAT